MMQLRILLPESCDLRLFLDMILIMPKNGQTLLYPVYQRLEDSRKDKIKTTRGGVRPTRLRNFGRFAQFSESSSSYFLFIATDKIQNRRILRSTKLRH